MTTPHQEAVFKIIPGIQPYAWGKKGSSSLAAQLAEVSIPDFQVEEEKTYAELWMGTHPNVPSKSTQDPSLTLSSILKENPSFIGQSISSKFPDTKEGSLPFLFKVLSIGTALSIQAHPDKKLAEQLFKDRPDVYKDDNHKPEMAIALTPFLAFLNFLPLPTILLHLLSTPELTSIIPSTLIDQLATSLTLPTTLPPDSFLFEPTISPPSDSQKELLKEIFGKFMSLPEDQVKDVIEKLVERYTKGEDIKESEKDLVELTLMLNDQYPNDVGILCVFLLNVVKLKKGEAAFLGANMPHAYISGDIIECMATSDNVVRAGLTPKLRDVKTLISMLTYEAGPGSKQLLQPTPFDSTSESGSETVSTLYDPPIDEFSVIRISLKSGSETQETKHRAVEGPSLVVVTEGEGSLSWQGEKEEQLEIKKGDVVFISADKEVGWKSEKGLEAYRAYVEVEKK